ncbi:MULTISPECIES: S66 family peptidase [Streptomyces]|uniref:S66 family peptidase n=1 Tax=Streptomyces TaxID=1883 RepID=UPI000B10A00D|nr:MULTISPECIES: S66 peptidase family protein [Streptomyces]
MIDVAPHPTLTTPSQTQQAIRQRMFATASSVGGSPATRGVATAFLDALTERGYELTPAARLTEADSSVTFVNATITPHKQALARGGRIGSICHYQPCFRAHGEHPWLFAFGMVGLLADVEGPDDLDRIAEDTHLATLAALGHPPVDRLHILIDSRDTDLQDSVGRAAALHGGVLHVLPDSTVGTRWTYGSDSPLTGRGITYYYRRPDVGCEPQCRPDCRCPRWQPLSNLIVVHNGERRYAEVGFGTEVTAAIPYGPNAFSLPEIADRVAMATGAGLADDAAADAVNLFRAVTMLVEDGARLSGKGPGSVVRKFVLRLLDLLDGTLGVEGGERLLARFGATRQLFDVLTAERRRREAAMADNLRAALFMLDRNPGTTDAELRSTYGVSEGQAHRLRQTRLRPPRLKAGDGVTVVSPSWRGGEVFPQRAARGAADLTARTGLRVSISSVKPGLCPESRAGRAEEFNRAVQDPATRAILWMIGGLTASELLPLIDYEAFGARPKVLCGYSDATVLHHALYARTGATTFYGPALLSQFAENGGTPELTMDSFAELTMRGWTGRFPTASEVIEEFVDWADDSRPRRAVPALPRKALRPGLAQGPLLAGCVPSALQLLGTPWLPDYRGHVLAFEFTDDNGYGPGQAARDLWQLRHAGLLDGVEGLVLGRPRGWSDAQREQLERIVLDVCHGTAFPIVTEFEFGHTDPVLTLPTGVPVELDNTTLTLLEPSVR